MSPRGRLQRSAHPLGVGKTMVYGSLRRYYLQNTHRKDYLKQIKLLFVHMKARGWTPKMLKELMIKAAASLESPKPTSIATELENNDKEERIFIHMEYYPCGINRQQLRTIFDKTCNNFNGTVAKVERVTVALPRPINLKDELTSAT